MLRWLIEMNGPTGFFLPLRQVGERQSGFYREGEAPAEPMPSSAGASLSHSNHRQVDFSLPLALRTLP